ncbi:MAG: triose-phosphate isomerase [Acidobacteria bacterium]|nr:triose-phosphate isomerase [Acidobacteriota bacterium]
MKRKPLLAGNWKMHTTIPESVELARAVAAGSNGLTDREVLVAPPFTSLQAVSTALAGTGVLLGAQNMHHEDTGAFTGEVSPVMLLSAGVTHVILGHSERRHVFGETDGTVNKKVLKAVRKGLVPILCVGETLEERDRGDLFTVVENQVALGFQGLTKDEAFRMIIAYEPVWAIGTGRTATPEQAEEMHVFIRRTLAERCAPDVAEGMRILYGGSVKPENISQLMAQDDIDGALVGGASLKAGDFLKIVNF